MRKLHDDGTVGSVRFATIQNIPERRVYGGCQPVPPAFQQQHNVGPYVCGWGGYASLITAAGGASLGPAIYFIPDPSSAERVRPKVAADFSGSTGRGDWYRFRSPGDYDRGARLSHPQNYFDNGDPRPNPPTRPTAPVAREAQWTSPAPDGKGRFVWGDSYYQTGVWIDGPNKHGFLLIASLCGGACWYQSSNLHFDRREAELHIFDPTHLGEVVAGKRRPWRLQPTTMVPLTLAGHGGAQGSGGFGLNGNTPVNNPAAATYDAKTGRLYVVVRAVRVYWARMYVFQVSS
jgi:hypothetical protein